MVFLIGSTISSLNSWSNFFIPRKSSSFQVQYTVEHEILQNQLISQIKLCLYLKIPTFFLLTSSIVIILSKIFFSSKILCERSNLNSFFLFITSNCLLNNFSLSTLIHQEYRQSYKNFSSPLFIQSICLQIGSISLISLTFFKFLYAFLQYSLSHPALILCLFQYFVALRIIGRTNDDVSDDLKALLSLVFFRKAYLYSSSKYYDFESIDYNLSITFSTKGLSQK